MENKENEFGRLTVKSFERAGRKTFCLCDCSCGKSKEMAMTVGKYKRTTQKHDQWGL